MMLHWPACRTLSVPPKPASPAWPACDVSCATHCCATATAHPPSRRACGPTAAHVHGRAVAPGAMVWRGDCASTLRPTDLTLATWKLRLLDNVEKASHNMKVYPSPVTASGCQPVDCCKSALASRCTVCNPAPRNALVSSSDCVWAWFGAVRACAGPDQLS